MDASIVIPAYNSCETLLKVLIALEKQTLSPKEVVIVDDASTDDTLERVKAFKKASTLKVRLISQEKLGPAAARNLGAKEATSDIVVFLDADCRPRRGWLSAMLAPFDDASVAGVQGTYETWNKGSWVARYVGYEIAYRHRVMRRKRDIDFVGSFSFAIRRDVLREAGGFDAAYPTAASEDQELAYRLTEQGHRLVYAPKAVVAHRHPESVGKYLRQQFFRGYWRVPVYRRHRGRVGGDSYTGRGLLLQGLLSALVWLTLPLFFTPLPYVFFLLLFHANLPFGVFCARRETPFLLIAPIMASLRSLAGTLGAAYGLVRPYRGGGP